MLVEQLYVDTIKLNEIYVSDGQGGFLDEAHYEDGATFKAAITLDRSIATAVAQKDGVKGSYTVTTPLTAKLKYGDIIKRVEDGKVFKITGKENTTPHIATFKFNVVSAEEWELPK